MPYDGRPDEHAAAAPQPGRVRAVGLEAIGTGDSKHGDCMERRDECHAIAVWSVSGTGVAPPSLSRLVTWVATSSANRTIESPFNSRG